MSGPNAEDSTDDGLHHVLPSPPINRHDVMATVLAHSDRGDGYCYACRELDPCGTKLYHEGVLREMNRWHLYRRTTP